MVIFGLLYTIYNYDIFAGFDLDIAYEFGEKMNVVVEYFGMAGLAALELFGDDVVDESVDAVCNHCILLQNEGLFSYR